MESLRVKFTHYTKVRDRNPYTVYEIAVQSPSTISWVIYKRYNDFHKLNNQLQKVDGLPKLPPKKIFMLMDLAFVENRKKGLQEYLSKLLQLPGLMRNPVLIDFLKVPDSVKPMLLNDPSSHTAAAASSRAVSSGPGRRGSYPNKSYEDRKVFELVDALHSSPNKVAAIADFEQYFFRYRPRLAKDVVRYLLIGQFTAESKKGGLIQTCGDSQYSKVASRSALDVICRLLDVERNKDAHTFVEVFASLGPGQLKLMNIGNHIEDERGSRLGAFRLVSILRDRMALVSTQQIVSNEGAWSLYLKWAERKRFVAPISNKSPTTQLLKSINLAEVPARKVAHDALKSILEVSEMTGWMSAQAKRYQLTPKTGEESRPQHEEHVDGKSFDGPAEVPPDPPPLEVEKEKGMEIEYKMHSDLVVVRIRCFMPFEVDTIATVILDESCRDQWDLKFHRGQSVVRLTPGCDIVHYVFKAFSSPYKFRDFCLLRCTTELNGSRLIAMRSVTHPRIPEQKNYQRAIFYPTGYLIVPNDGSSQPIEGLKSPSGKLLRPESKEEIKGRTRPPATNGSILTFIAQMDRDSVLLVSPDLLGETDELLQSMRNLEKLLEMRVARENVINQAETTGAANKTL